MRLRFFAPLWLLVLLLAPPGLSAAVLEITLFHTTDLHGYAFPYQGPKGKYQLGSFASMVPILEKARADGRQFLFFDLGDFMQGTLEDKISRGQIITRVMNDPLLGYDARVLGNHDFDYGWDNCRERSLQAKHPILATNITATDPGLLDFKKDWILLERQGIKFGIFGLVYSGTGEMLFPEHQGPIRFELEKNFLETIPEKLRAQGADFVILLAHVGMCKKGPKRQGGVSILRSDLMNVIRDQKDPRKRIDVVLDGHTHVALYKKFLDRSKDGFWNQVQGIVQKFKEGRVDEGPAVYFAQAGNYGEFLGELRLSIDAEKKHITHAESHLHYLRTDRYPVSEAFLAHFAVDLNNAKKWNQEILARTEPDFCLGFNREAGWQENETALFLARSFFEFARDHGTPAHLGVMNNAGTRTNLFATGDAVTREALHKTCPFENELVAVTLNGRDLLNMIKYRGRELTFGGLKFQFIDRVPPGHSIQAEKVLVQLPEGVEFAVNPADEYTLVCPDFLTRTDQFLAGKKRLSEKGLKATDQDAIIHLLKKMDREAAAAGSRLTREMVQDRVGRTVQILSRKR